MTDFCDRGGGGGIGDSSSWIDEGWEYVTVTFPPYLMNDYNDGRWGRDLEIQRSSCEIFSPLAV